jgi:pimeloyl-ACP methyl ester carboxylesterase
MDSDGQNDVQSTPSLPREGDANRRIFSPEHARRPPLNSEEIEVTDEPTWFGPPSDPLFGWLTRPKSAVTRGRVVIVPSVGYEARSAKVAIRHLAWTLARSGFITLRFDFRGTGDSSGDFGDFLPNPDWVDDTISAISFIQSNTTEPVSVVGFRLGATLAAAAVSDSAVNVASLVLWDPCESGWSYLRELRALESLRREEFTDDEDGSVETTEFLFSKEMVNALRTLKLTTLLQSDFVGRTLVITRAARPLSSKLRDHFEITGATLTTTTEQEMLLDVPPFDAEVPYATTDVIVNWLAEFNVLSSNDVPITPVAETLMYDTNGEAGIRERAVFLSEPGIFAFFSEPVLSPVGPWIVMIGNVHDDHTGQSRIWVELSRRWAQSGFRCVRVDLSGLGESSRPNQVPFVEHFDSRWVTDVVALARYLDPSDPSNVVFVGFCASATLAMEGALALDAKGICLINPAPGRNLSHAIYELQMARSGIARFIASQLNHLLLNHPWAATNVWETLRPGFPKRWSKDILQEIEERGSDILVLSNPEDQSTYRCEGYVRSIEERPADVKRNYLFELVPDLDHSMTIATGRSRTVELLEEHVRSTYLTHVKQ